MLTNLHVIELGRGDFIGWCDPDEVSMSPGLHASSVFADDVLLVVAGRFESCLNHHNLEIITFTSRDVVIACTICGYSWMFKRGGSYEGAIMPDVRHELEAYWRFNLRARRKASKKKRK